MSRLPIRTYDFHPIDLEDIKNALNKSLKEYFAEVDVSISQCPDFSQAPFHLAAEGIGGGFTGIIDLGGPGNLLPRVDRSKVYNLSSLLPQYIGTENFPDGWYLSGAGAGPWVTEGSNCEMVVSMKLGPDGQVTTNKSRVALTVDGVDGKEVKMKCMKQNDANCAVLGNYTVSSGIRGKVIEIKCKRRISENTNFTASIRQALSKNFPSQPIGLGGVFFIRNSQSKVFIMPDFSKTPLMSAQEVNNWLNFFQMNPPMLFQSVLVSSDPGLGLRVEHSHGWSSTPGKCEGGHYDQDLMPYTVEYHGYFAVAERLWRVDREPQIKGRITAAIQDAQMFTYCCANTPRGRIECLLRHGPYPEDCPGGICNLPEKKDKKTGSNISTSSSLLRASSKYMSKDTTIEKLNNFNAFKATQLV